MVLLIYFLNVKSLGHDFSDLALENKIPDPILCVFFCGFFCSHCTFFFTQRLQTLSPIVNALFFSTAFIVATVQVCKTHSTCWNKENFTLILVLGVFFDDAMYKEVVRKKKLCFCIVSLFYCLFVLLMFAFDCGG